MDFFYGCPFYDARAGLAPLMEEYSPLRALGHGTLCNLLARRPNHDGVDDKQDPGEKIGY